MEIMVALGTGAIAMATAVAAWAIPKARILCTVEGSQGFMGEMLAMGCLTIIMVPGATPRGNRGTEARIIIIKAMPDTTMKGTLQKTLAIISERIILTLGPAVAVLKTWTGTGTLEMRPCRPTISKNSIITLTLTTAVAVMTSKVLISH
jgi:phosphohistidine swiveling domain-containing protein